MQKEIIISGFGGQGVLFAGQVIAYAAMDSGNSSKLQHWAHTLKGSLLTMGAAQTAARAESIERAAAEGRLAELPSQVRQVVAETVVIVAQLGGDPAALAG